MSATPTGPLPLTHARGLAAALRAARDSKIDVASVVVHVERAGNGPADLVLVHDPARVAADGERRFRGELERAVREILDGTDEQGKEKVGPLKAGWRAALSYCGRKASDVTPAPLKTAAAVTYKGAVIAKNGIVYGAELAKPATMVAGRWLGRAYNSAAKFVAKQVTSRSEIARDVLHRAEYAQMVATRVIIDVTHTDGAVSCFAPWVIDPVATLKNAQLTASLNGAVSVFGVSLAGSAMQLAAAGTFGVWGLLSSDPSQRTSKVNMALDQLLSSAVSAIPFSNWVVAPLAAAQDISDLVEIKENMREGDPFVSFFPTRTGSSENEGEAASRE